MKKANPLTARPLKFHPQKKKSQITATATMEDMEQLVVDPLESILIGGLSNCTYVSSLMFEEERARLQQILQVNADVFA